MHKSPNEAIEQASQPDEIVKKIVDIRAKSMELEKRLVTGLLYREEKIAEVASFIKASDFTSRHKDIFALIVETKLKGEDVWTAVNKTGIQIFREYNNIDNFVGLTYEFKSIADEVKKLSFSGSFLTLLLRTYENTDENKIEENYSKFYQEIVDLANHREVEVSTIAQLMTEYDIIQKTNIERMKSGKKLLGFSSGFEKIDSATDGIRPGHLWVIGGYTSSGKTQCSLQIVKSAIEQGKRVVYFSLEMMKEDIISRLLGMITGINGTHIVKGLTSSIQDEQVKKAKDMLVKSDLSIHAEVSDLNEIKTVMLEQSYKKQVDLFVLDFIQLIRSDGRQTEYELMRDAAKQLQAILKKIKVPMILLSQLSNESARNPNSQVMGFKGAGDIAAAADLAIELQSDEDDEPTRRFKLFNGEQLKVKAVIRKNRHGRVGDVLLYFDGKTGIFTDRDAELDIFDAKDIPSNTIPKRDRTYQIEESAEEPNE